MSPLMSLRSRYTKCRHPMLGVEQLERRDVPSSLSVADVTVREGPASLGAIDPAGAAALNLAYPRNIVFDSISSSAHYGDLFVTSNTPTGFGGEQPPGQVLRFDMASQTYQPFVSPGSGGLQSTGGITFGPDGNLYVTSPTQSEIFEYDGTTGNFLSVYVSAGAGGLSNPYGIKFASDGDLYVCSSNTNQILKYEGPGSPDGVQAGQFLGVFANTQHTFPFNFDFGPDGNVYVSCPEGAPNTSASFIDRYYGPSSPLAGQFIGTFVANGTGGLSDSRTPLFDQQGNLYVADMHLNEVLEYQGPYGSNPGAYIQAYVTTGQGNLAAPNGMAIGPDGNLYVSSRDTNQVLRYAPSSQASFVVTLSSGNTTQVSVNYATADGTAVAGTDYVQTAGTLVFPAGATSETINVPILSVTTGGPTKAFTMNLSSPVNATITRGQGTGNILNRMTKFFVADSGSSPMTYQYGSGGTSEEISLQLSNDTAPRGVATTAAGTTVWVVDANRNVYVYSNHGVLLGFWSPGGLSYSAQLTGIATDGTNIWLVDSYSGKVYKYAGAASRLSGSQNAASSFSLASGRNGNTDPQDLVTDGTSFWVVDGTALKVFKYTLSGSALGSWSIDPANTHPTGITIDPSNVSNIWIVDNGTDKVYQYTAAATRTSGSQSAAATFALAPGDTNPQGIADPPPSMLLTSTPAPSSPELPSVAGFNAAASDGGQISAAVPSLTSRSVPFAASNDTAVAGGVSLASRDALFALLAGESLQSPSAPATDLRTSGPFTPFFDTVNSVPNRAWTLADASSGQDPDRLTSATSGGSDGTRSGRGAVGLLDDAWVDEESQTSAAAAE
jgi:sugar lactone lactonase YvrE